MSGVWTARSRSRTTDASRTMTQPHRPSVIRAHNQLGIPATLQHQFRRVQISGHPVQFPLGCRRHDLPWPVRSASSNSFHASAVPCSPPVQWREHQRRRDLHVRHHRPAGPAASDGEGPIVVLRPAPDASTFEAATPAGPTRAGAVIASRLTPRSGQYGARHSRDRTPANPADLLRR